MQWTVAAFALSVAAGLSCSGGTLTGAPPPSSGQQCKWPSSLNDAGSGSCLAAPAYVKCEVDAGIFAGSFCVCLSDSSTCDSCAGPPASCQSYCGAGQYAVACGGNATEPPPSDCTFVDMPCPECAGYYCCPCQ
jgi:hypothetical protein